MGKDWTIASDGARFNPFPDTAGDNVPTIYAATTYEAAALESVFHQVPHIQTPEVMRSQVETWEYFELRTLRDLRVVRLTNPQLRQLKVPRRSESLREHELIHSPASQYPATRTWAKLLHDHIPGLDGLAIPRAGVLHRKAGHAEHVEPRHRAHDVADPRRQEQKHNQKTAPTPSEPRKKICGSIADECADQRGDKREPQGFEQDFPIERVTEELLPIPKCEPRVDEAGGGVGPEGIGADGGDR